MAELAEGVFVQLCGLEYPLTLSGQIEGIDDVHGVFGLWSPSWKSGDFLLIHTIM